MSTSVHVTTGLFVLAGIVYTAVAGAEVKKANPDTNYENSVEQNAPGSGVDELASREVIETFTPPSRKHSKAPRYPRKAHLMGREGWVKLNFMVGPEGRPYDITVVDASNEPGFGKEAMRAVKRWQYEPAHLEGTPIDAGSATMITFELSGGEPGEKRSFSKLFRELQSQLADNNRAGVEETLAALDTNRTSIYEEAFFNLARYQYFFRWGTSTDQLEALEKATAMDGDRGFLPDATLTQALQNTLALEMELGRLGHAEETAHQLLKRDIDEKTQTSLHEFLAEMADVRASKRRFHASGRFEKGVRDFYRLVHQSFAVTDIEGDIAELRLHCDKGYKGFIYEPDMVYSINPEWRHCGLVLIGNPHTTYRILDGA